MCHKYLTFDFGDQLNFIVGEQPLSITDIYSLYLPILQAVMAVSLAINGALSMQYESHLLLQVVKALSWPESPLALEEKQ